MSIMKKTSAALLLSLAASAASAQTSDLLLTLGEKAGQQNLSFEFVNDGGVTSMQFDVEFPGMKLESVNQSSCVAGLPKTFSGACSLKNNRLRVLVYSMANEPIPSGMIGSVDINASRAQVAQSAKVSGLILAAPDGARPAGEAFVDFAGVKPGSVRSDR